MKRLGDITKIHGDQIEPVDCITFGSPCQDLSIAGKRLGFDGNRSVLFLDAARIIKEMRTATNGMYPTFAVWENVPGALSSNGGEDFRTALEELARIAQPDVSIPRPSCKRGRWSKAGAIAGNGWSLAWRQLDAQHWGVPQRRKRIALVVDFGGQRAGEILFERTGVSGNPDESIKAWEATPGTAEKCPAKDNRVVGAKSFCLQGNMIGRKEENGPLGRGVNEDVSFTLNTTDRHAVAYTLKIRSGCEGGGKGALVQTEKSATLSTLQDQTLFVADILPFDTTQVTSPKNGCSPKWGDPCHPLAASAHTPTVIVKVYDNHAQDARYSELKGVRPTVTARWGTGGGNTPIVARQTFNEQSFSHYKESDKCSTLKAKAGNIGNGSECLIAEKTIRWIVRRLTPVECERLQGFPDNYTNIGDWTDSKGKKHKYADSPRYKALGNSIALPQWFWLVQKMRPYLKEKPTLGSLFDGLGGFPLVWQRAYGEGTARWASEVDNFCIAITRKRFPDVEES